MAVASISQAGFPPAGGSLALLSIPFIFTQDELLTTGDFMKQAKERGHNLSLNGLRVLHEYRLLVPLYRVSDTPVQGRRINVEINGGMNVRRWVLEAGDAGRLRDSADEGYSKAWPYSRADDEPDHHWWNGCAFSSWQLLDLQNAINDYQIAGL